ncbi:hypothetical protein AUQ48_17125 [Kocuria flava]|uniref:Uncharacterized protein n=1 Tax=Kocuria flava TaxID=446860 RepID=A0A2N4SXT9_9MICC|nr:hypothetical protein AUQ48_17125 [Kocuria flava]
MQLYFVIFHSGLHDLADLLRLMTNLSKSTAHFRESFLHLGHALQGARLPVVVFDHDVSPSERGVVQRFL